MVELMELMVELMELCFCMCFGFLLGVFTRIVADDIMFYAFLIAVFAAHTFN